MIDDARIRAQILKNIPTLDPWRIEMEEMNFGDSIGCSVLIDGIRERFSTQSWAKAGRDAPKKEGTIAFDLSQQIKAAMQSTPDAPATVNHFGKIVKADDGSSRTSGS